MKLSLEIKLGSLKLKNPVMAASGTFGTEYGKFLDLDSLGAYVTKTITLNARAGNPPPRVCETSSGMLNSIGLENKGLEDFVKNKIPELNKLETLLIVSIAGDNPDEFARIARSLSKVKKVSAIELNLSCPNVKHGNKDCLTAQDEKATYETVEAVRKVTALTVIAKLSPNVTDITKIARAAEDAGADAVSLVNTLIGMAVDINARRSILGNTTGGLSGPAVKPVALRMVYEVRKKCALPIIGIGGIMDHVDALEFIMCGASAVQVGTANFVDPAATAGIIKGIRSYMAENRVKDINELIGVIKK